MAKKIANEHGVGTRTVQRAEKFAKGVDEAEKLSPGMKEKILSGKIKVPKVQPPIFEVEISKIGGLLFSEIR